MLNAPTLRIANSPYAGDAPDKDCECGQPLDTDRAYDRGQCEICDETYCYICGQAHGSDAAGFCNACNEPL